MKPFRFDCLALCDVEEAARYYDRQQPGLGQRFKNAVADTVERIAANPELYPRVSGGLRKCRVPRFPHGVLYRFDGKRVDILVVMHLHRQPGFWKKRVRAVDPAE